MASASSRGASGGTTSAEPESMSTDDAVLSGEIEATIGRPLAMEEAIFDGKFAFALTSRCMTTWTSAEAYRSGYLLAGHGRREPDVRRPIHEPSHFRGDVPRSDDFEFDVIAHVVRQASIRVSNPCE